MKICLVLSPLAMIFQPKYHQTLMVNPELLMAEEPKSFDVVLRRSTGDFHMKYATPKQIADPLLLNWVTGGVDGDLSQETDYSGCVQLPLSEEETGFVFAALTGMEKSKELLSAIDVAKDKAKAKSAERVMRAIRRTHSNLMKQYERNKEQQGEMYSPSATEFLCSYVLASEESKRAEDQQKVTNEFQALMKKIGMLPS